MMSTRRAGSFSLDLICPGRSWSSSHLCSILQLSDASFIQNKRTWKPSALEQILQALGRGREGGREETLALQGRNREQNQALPGPSA